MDLYTGEVYPLPDGDGGLMATKCEDGTWIVWEFWLGLPCMSHIAFFNWEEVVIFLFEEADNYNAVWIPEIFGFREEVNPFQNEPDFEFYREVLGG
ncbi:hypothetical protein IC620_01550 [Hazenella sp. IB182357]|uniref:Uncharacterized protein n=1 Tax=Polycladospora coralii TaxID=2771432 RepID=A0A926N4U2_9BACL|nr:hypothetical protein [Polycladospora coralii]MBD1371044.1 hypothetical protein [Polycladospora coralii]